MKHLYCSHTACEQCPPTANTHTHTPLYLSPSLSCSHAFACVRTCDGVRSTHVRWARRSPPPTADDSRAYNGRRCRGSVSLCKLCLPDEKEAGAATMFAAPDCVKLASGTSEGLLLYLAVILTIWGCSPLRSYYSGKRLDSSRLALAF